VGTCIGKRNYKYFFVFVALLFLLCLFVFVQVVIVLTRLEIAAELGYFVVNIVLVLYIFVAWAFVSVLLGFHVYLVVSNTTTNEFCKDSWQTISGNPFSKYCWLHAEPDVGRTVSRYLGRCRLSWATPRWR
jgi:palmitoyltransferase ZDHHC9/14/18